jgi:hypothetical protein
MIFMRITTGHGGGERRTPPCDGRTPSRRDAYASASEDHHLQTGAGCDARHHTRSAIKMERQMRNFKHTSVRAAGAIATFVALIASVGAPWKWS